MRSTLIPPEVPLPQPLDSVETGDERAPMRNCVRPVAVLLPPLVSVACVGTVSALTELAAGGGRPVLAASLGVCLLGLLYVQRTLAAGGDRVGGRLSVSLALGASCAGVALLLLPAGAVLPVTLVTALAAALAAIHLAPRWRRRLTTWRRAPVTLLAGSEASAEGAVRRIEALGAFDVVSLILPGLKELTGKQVLGRPVATTAFCEVRTERRVLVSRPARNQQVEAYVARLIARGHEIRSESAATRLIEGRVDTVKADPLSLLMALRPSRLIEGAWVVCTSVLALAALVLLSPLFLLIGLAIAVETGMPVFYRQTRVGWRGRLFEVLKFRTMRQDAEDGSGPVFAGEEDPRITRVGRFLRHYRLDELPQLWNVVKGQMGLVGPRPERPHFFQVFRDDVPLFDLRTCVRPGITGWAQVRMPYAVDVDDARAKLEHDLYYVTCRSLVFDLAILFDTVNVALSGAGAR